MSVHKLPRKAKHQQFQILEWDSSHHSLECFMFACNLLTNKNICSLIMQKHNLCKIITLTLEGTTKATYTAKTQNSLVIYLIHVIQTLPQTPTQSHSRNFPWCCFTAVDLWHRKALWHWWHHVCCAQGTCPTSSSTHTLLTGCGWGPWHGWTLSDHGQELLFTLRFQFGRFYSTEETQHMCHKHM